MRANFLMQHWVGRVFSVKHIKVFKAFFSAGGEFPFVKAIGYRRLFCLPRNPSRARYTAVLKSAKRFGSYDGVLPLTAKKVGIRHGFRFLHKAFFTNKLKCAWRDKKLARASYNRFRTPAIIAKGEAGDQLRRLFYLETSSAVKNNGFGDAALVEDILTPSDGEKLELSNIEASDQEGAATLAADGIINSEAAEKAASDEQKEVYYGPVSTELDDLYLSKSPFCSID